MLFPGYWVQIMDITEVLLATPANLLWLDMLFCRWEYQAISGTEFKKIIQALTAELSDDNKHYV
jgi:hypothetical protein